EAIAAHAPSWVRFGTNPASSLCSWSSGRWVRSSFDAVRNPREPRRTRLPLGHSDPHRTRHPGPSETTVPTRVPVQLLLSVVLRQIELARWTNLSRDLTVPRGLQLVGVDRLAGLSSLRLVLGGRVDRRSVLSS